MRVKTVLYVFFQLEDGGSEEDCICDLVEFAMTLCQKLQEVNKDAFNTFQLRVGIRLIQIIHHFYLIDYNQKFSNCSSGSLVSGVIGARKPVYDIWGNIFLMKFEMKIKTIVQ